MARHTLNDNDSMDTDTPIKPDSHGQAALLLVESLIHTLISREIVSVEDAAEIVKTAAEVEIELDAEHAQLPDRRSASTLLNAIGESLKFDLPRPD